MIVAGIKIENFRNIKSLILDDFGRFNILVGKNNAGKSTLITAIDYFFKMIDPLLATQVLVQKDFHNRNLDTPIEISCSFEFNTDKDEDIYNTMFTLMKEEHPEIMVAIESLSNFSFVNIYIKSYIQKPDKIFSCINKITLSEECPFTTEKNIREELLLNINSPVIEEYVDRFQKNASLKETLAQINKFLSDFSPSDFNRWKEMGSLPKFRIGKIYDEINELFTSATSYSEFRSSISNEIEKYEGEIKKLHNASTAHAFSVLSGMRTTLPEHLYHLLEKIKNTRILRELERKKSIDQHDAQELLKLKNRRGKGEKLEQLQKIVKNILGTNLDAFQSDDEEGKAEIDIDDFIVDMNGAGIKESLRLILDLEFTNPEIIFLEEPEVHLHFGLEKKLLNYLVQFSIENNVQFFITTHSTGFIDASETSSIYLVKKDNDTKISSLGEDKFSDILSELGLSVSSLLLAKSLIFVEGPSDEFIIREYLSQLYPEVSYADVGFIQMKGVGNYKYYAGAETLELLAKKGLKSTFIVDLDNRNDQDIKKVVDRHPSFSQIEILPVRCIENLFLDPSTLTEFMKRKIIQSGTRREFPTIELIEKQIDEIIEDLYPETVRLFISDKYLKSIHPNSLNEKTEIHSADQAMNWVREGILKINEYASNYLQQFETSNIQDLEEVEEQWKKNKLSIVPGDQVIDKLCKKYGLRYKKKQNDANLLCQSTKGKCPEAIEQIVSSIVQTINSYQD